MTTGDSSNVLERLVTVFSADTAELEAAFTKAATKAQAEGARIGQGLAVGLKNGVAGAASEIDRVGAQIDKGRQSLALIRSEQAAGIATSAQYVSALRTQQDALRGMVGQVQKGGDAYRGLVAELAGVTQELDNVSAAGKQSGGFLAGITGGLLQGAQGTGLGGVIDLIQNLQQGLAGLSDSGGDTEDAMSGVGDSVNNAAEHIQGFVDARKEEDAATREANMNQAKAALAFTVTTAAVGALGMALTDAFNKAADFEAAMNKAAATTEATGAELAQLKTLALSREIEDLAVNGTEAAGAIEELGGAGLSTAQILDGALQPTLNLSRAVGVDVATAAEVAAASMKSFGLEASELNTVADVITVAVNGTSIKMGDFAQALAQGGAVARTAGLDFTTFTAAISFMTDRAISASDAGTSLKTFLQSLTPTGAAAKKAMDDLGISVFTASGEYRPFADIIEDLREAFSKLTPEQRASAGQTLFGADGIRAFNILVEQGADGIRDRTAQLGRMGAADEASATQLQGVRSAQQEFNTALHNFGIIVGETFLPAASKMLVWAKDFLSTVRDGLTEYNKLARGMAGFGAEEYNLPTWLKRTGLRESDLTDKETMVATRILATMQGQANVGAKNAAQWRTLGSESTALKVEERTVRIIGELGRELIAIQAAAAQRPRTLGPDYDPTAEPVDMSTIAAESGKFGYAYISKLKDVFVNDPKVDSDCAVIASAILNNIGVKIKGSANAGTLEKNALGAGFQKVEGDEIRPGDLIVWTSGNGKTYGLNSGKHVGVAAGMKNGQMMVINNPGSKDTQVEAMYDKQNATVYRAPTSAFDMAGNLRGPADLIPTAPQATGAALLAQARSILKSLETKDPDALVAAQAALKAFEDSGDRAKAALKIVREELGKTKKSVSDFGQGFDALKKQMEGAQDYKRLNDDGAAYARTLDTISAAALKAAEVEKGKFGETKKYDALRGLGADAAAKARTEREAIAREAEKGEKEADARAKKAQQLSAQVAEAARKGDVTLAKQREATLSQMRENDLRAAGENAAAKLAVEQRYADKQEAAAKAVADLEYRNAMGAAARGGAQLRDQREQEAANQKRLAYLKAEGDAEGRLEAAQKAATDKATARAKEQRDLRAKVAAEARDLTVKAAEATYARTQELNRQELAEFKGNAVQRAAIVRRQAEDEYKAQEQAERAKRDALIRTAENGPAQNREGRIDAANTAYDAAMLKAAGLRAKILADSDKAMTDLGVKLATTLADSVGAGLEAGLRSKRADEAITAKSLEMGAGMVSAWNDAAIGELIWRQIDEELNPIIYQTEEQIRNLGVTTEETASTYFNLADAIENAGSMGRDELAELIRLSGLGADAALELWAAWNQKNPVDLGKQLEAIMQAQALGDRLDAAVDPVEIQGITQDIAGFLASDLGKLLPEGVREGLLAGIGGAEEYAAILSGITADAITDGWERAGKAGGAVENAFQDYAAQIMGGAFDLSDSGTLRGLNEGLDEAFKKGQLTAGQLETLRLIIDSINNNPLEITGRDEGGAALESAIGAITSKIDEAQAGYESGAIGTDAYNAALIEQEAALLKLLVSLERLGPAGAAGAASVRLLLAATSASIDPTARLAEEIGTLGQEKAADLAQQAVKLSQGLQAGTITQKEFNASAVDMLPTLDRLAVSLSDGSEEGEKAAATIRAIARDLRDMGAAITEAQSKLEGLGDGFQKLSAGLSRVFKGFGADGMGQIVDGLGNIVSAASKAPAALASVRESWASFKKAPDAGALGTLLGSLGGVVGIAGAVIGAIGSIGDALMKNNPAIQAQIKGWLELAAAEREAMGSRKVGGRNGFLNPYYDALKEDADALTQKANAGFWQRLGWSLFGNAPKTMDKAASEALQESSSMFNEFGASLYSTLESSLMNAFETGDWSGSEAAFEKSLNGLMARMALQAVIATSDLGDRIKALVDARVSAMADGVISPEEQAELDGMAQGISASARGIRATWQGIAPTLPGYGDGAQEGANGAPGGALFGNAPGAQLGIPRVEVSLPASMTQGFTDFAGAVPVFSEASSRMLQAANLLLTLNRGGPPPLSGLGGLV